MPLERRSVRRHWALIAAPGGMFRRGVVALLALVVVMLLPAGAQASVPMCSNDGRTVAAPPIILPWRQLTLEAAKPCQQPDNVLLRAMPDQQQKSPSSAPAPAPPRAMPVRGLDVPRPPGVRERVVGASSPSRFLLVESVYRPPRA
jgi:hypothetical protein